MFKTFSSKQLFLALSDEIPYTQTIYLFKANNRNITKRYETCLKLKTNPPEQRHLRPFGVFFDSFEHISHLFLVYRLLDLNRYMQNQSSNADQRLNVPKNLSPARNSGSDVMKQICYLCLPSFYWVESPLKAWCQKNTTKLAISNTYQSLSYQNGRNNSKISKIIYFSLIWFFVKDRYLCIKFQNSRIKLANPRISKGANFIPSLSPYLRQKRPMELELVLPENILVLISEKKNLNLK